MNFAFDGASNFNQCLSSWPPQAREMFAGTKCNDVQKCQGLECKVTPDPTPAPTPRPTPAPTPGPIDKWELVAAERYESHVYLNSLEPLSGFVLYEYNRDNTDLPKVEIYTMPEDGKECSEGEKLSDDLIGSAIAEQDDKITIWEG